MKAAMTERIDLSNPFIEHMDLCLTCRACETACPSGVSFGELMEKTRVVLIPHKYKTKISKWMVSFLLEKVIPSHRALSLLFSILWIYEKIGLQWLMRSTPLRFFLPGRIRFLEESLPHIPFRPFSNGKTQIYNAVGEKKGRIALFTGCFMNHLFPNVHQSTVRLLTWNGYDVIVPNQQTCCGALHLHLGDYKTAFELAQINISTFSKISYDTLVVNSAGCSAHLKHYDRFDSTLNISDFTKNIKDIAEFFDNTNLRIPPAALDLKVVYDEPCHLIHAQGITGEPKRLIDFIPGVTLLPLEEQDRCCGSAGSYMITQTDMSKKILNRKISKIEATDADVVVTANPGCQIQLEYGIRQRKSDTPVLHIAELLDLAYRNDVDYSKL